MTLVRLAAEAADDLEQAIEWYEAQAPSLGYAFLQEVRRVMQLIAVLPAGYPREGGQTRRALLAASRTSCCTNRWEASSSCSRSFISVNTPTR